MNKLDVFLTKFSEMDQDTEKELIEGTPYKDKWVLLDCVMTEYETNEKKTKLYNILFWVYFFWWCLQFFYLDHRIQDFFEPVKFLFIFHYLTFLWGIIPWFLSGIVIGPFESFVMDKKKNLNDLLNFVKINRNDWLKHRSTDRKYIKELIGYLGKWK